MSKAVGSLNEGIENMGKNLPYARNLFEFLDLRIFAPELLHCPKSSFLHGFGFIH